MLHDDIMRDMFAGDGDMEFSGSDIEENMVRQKRASCDIFAGDGEDDEEEEDPAPGPATATDGPHRHHHHRRRHLLWRHLLWRPAGHGLTMQ